MPLFADFSSSILDWSCVVALAVFCVLQHLHYRRQLMAERQERRLLKVALEKLELRHQELYQELLSTAVGNELLREFLAGQSPEEMVRVLQARLNADQSGKSDPRRRPEANTGGDAPGDTLPASELSETWQRAEERLVQLLVRAQMDALTQIANRHTLDIELDRELRTAQATGSELSLIMLDVDHFKTVNDTHGHQAGDEILKAFAGILRDSLSQFRAGERAICARYGGDEFAVVLPGRGAEEAARIAELIREHVLRFRITWQEQAFQITISGGCATYPEHGQSVAELIAAADAALLSAKSQGRNAIGRPWSPKTS